MKPRMLGGGWSGRACDGKGDQWSFSTALRLCSSLKSGISKGVPLSRALLQARMPTLLMVTPRYTLRKGCLPERMALANSKVESLDREGCVLVEVVGQHDRVHVVLEELVVFAVGRDAVALSRLLELLLPPVAQRDQLHADYVRSALREALPRPPIHAHADGLCFFVVLFARLVVMALFLWSAPVGLHSATLTHRLLGLVVLSLDGLA